MQLTDRDLESRYNDFLSECYGMIKICGLEYDAAMALKKIDPVAYRCGFNDWLDSECGKTIFEHDGEYYDEEQESA